TGTGSDRLREVPRKRVVTRCLSPFFNLTHSTNKIKKRLMSIRALNSAASGMEAMTFRLDVIANNLANAQTTAFKRSRVNFEDLYYQQFKIPGAIDQQGRPTSEGLAMGLGVRVQSTELDQTPGSLLSTGGNLDLAIVGDGFFQINDGNQF